MTLLALIPGGRLVQAMVVAATLAALAGAATYAVHRYNEGLRGEGRAEVRAQVLVDQTEALQNRQKDDKLLRQQNRRIENVLEQNRAARLLADRAVADSLRQLDAALAQGDPRPAHPAAPSSPDADRAADDGADPRPRIARECAAALAALDARAQRLVDEKTGLQRYATEVCLSGAPPATTE